MSDYSFVGKERARPDAGDKVAGRTAYIHDLTRPGMLHGKIKFSEHAHARIVNIDTSRAKRLPGVRAVITAYDTPEVRVGFLADNFALKKGKVRQFRDEVAAVAAIDPDIAREAVELIKVEYEPLPGVFSPLDALAPGAPLVHELDGRGKPRTSNLVDLKYGHHTGELEAMKRASRHIVEGSYSTPRIQQACMGTAGCIAEFDGQQNLTIYAKTQIPFLAQRDFTKALEAMGLEGRGARVVVPALGGGFGTGLDTHCYEHIAILLAHKTGLPVKILYDRTEEFAYLSPRQSAETRVVQGCDEHGKLTFRIVEVLQDNGAYISWGATYPSVMMLPVTSLYRVPAVSFDAKIVYTNNTYCQAMRGYGNPEVTFPIESNLDDLAREAGIDPLELRRKNANQPGDESPMKFRISTCGLDDCLGAVGQKLRWSEKQGRGRKDARGRALGVGVSSLVHVGGSGRIYRSDGSGIAIRLDDFGHAHVAYGGVEMGQGLVSSLTAAVAESLGVLPEQVQLNQTDTAACPWDVGTHASRGAFMACNAAIRACKELRAKLFALCPGVFEEIAGKALGSKAHGGKSKDEVKTLVGAPGKPEDYELKHALVTKRGLPDEPWAKVELAKVLRAVHFRQAGTMLSAEYFYEPPSELPDWEKGIGNMSAAYTWGAQGVEVAVDQATGEVEVLHMVNALDVGHILSPQALKGQVYGGIAQGLGYALYEEILSEQGRCLNPGFTDYKIPTAVEMRFPIDLVFIETEDPNGPFGSKGVGEPGLVPTAPAIGNAIKDALGVRMKDLPMTPERVSAALEDARKIRR
ncbi:MAG: xanthine dehydrogenase family protein molybdopterin-binding subunit [Deltaproteobacteria bacterium]|nr:xanthine dehydrogenase family protein molybdopterin-binding subunit [Deltaproteobacteria bacterium]